MCILQEVVFACVPPTATHECLHLLHCQHKLNMLTASNAFHTLQQADPSHGLNACIDIIAFARAARFRKYLCREELSTLDIDGQGWTHISGLAFQLLLSVKCATYMFMKNENASSISSPIKKSSSESSESE